MYYIYIYICTYILYAGEVATEQEGEGLVPCQGSREERSEFVYYICNVHTNCMLERLLLNKKGRDLFPVRVPERKGQSSCTDVHIIILYIYVRSQVG